MKKVTFDEFAAAYCETQVQTPDNLKEILLKQKVTFNPDGWMLLECEQFDSSKFGDKVILPYGPNNTFKTPPDHPISPRGLASDMSIVIAILEKEDL